MSSEHGRVTAAVTGDTAALMKRLAQLHRAVRRVEHPTACWLFEDPPDWCWPEHGPNGQPDGTVIWTGVFCRLPDGRVERSGRVMPSRPAEAVAA